MSITMGGGLIERESVDRRVDSKLSPEAHLLVQANDLAYNMMRMWQGVLGLGRFDCLVSPAYIVLKPTGRVNPAYAEHLFSAAASIAKFKRASYGVVDDRLRLYHGDLAKLRFAVPEDVSEQEMIALIISTLCQTITHAEALLEKQHRVMAGLMHDIFSRGLTSDGRLRPTQLEAPESYWQSPVGCIPQDWKVNPISKYGTVKLGRQRSPNQHSGRWTTPYLRVANVLDGFIDFADVLEMDFTPEERAAFSLRRGDILLNEGQSLELVGRCALYNEPEDQYCFQNTLVRFRCFDGQEPTFYRFLFKWFLDRGLFTRIAKQTTSVAHLGADRFARMQCIDVAPDEQRRIAECLGAVQGWIDRNQADLNKLRHLKAGLMHDLLTGRVRVKLDEAATA